MVLNFFSASSTNSLSLYKFNEGVSVSSIISVRIYMTSSNLWRNKTMRVVFFSENWMPRSLNCRLAGVVKLKPWRRRCRNGTLFHQLKQFRVRLFSASVKPALLKLRTSWNSPLFGECLTLHVARFCAIFNLYPIMIIKMFQLYAHCNIPFPSNCIPHWCAFIIVRRSWSIIAG